MKTVLDFLSAAFRLLILKPFDFLLFGGSEILVRPREEWRQMIQNDLRAVGPSKEPVRIEDAADEGSMFPKWLTTNLPTVYDGPQGESFFMDVEK